MSRAYRRAAAGGGRDAARAVFAAEATLMLGPRERAVAWETIEQNSTRDIVRALNRPRPTYECARYGERLGRPRYSP